MFQKFANMAASGKQFSCPLGMGGKQELFGMTDSNSGGEGGGQKHPWRADDKHTAQRCV